MLEMRPLVQTVLIEEIGAFNQAQIADRVSIAVQGLIVAQFQFHRARNGERRMQMGGGIIQGLRPIEDGKHIAQVFRRLAKSASNRCAAVRGWGNQLSLIGVGTVNRVQSTTER